MNLHVAGVTAQYHWIASDSWGAKIYPVEKHEWAAEGTVTILPQKTELTGEITLSIHEDGTRYQNIAILFSLCFSFCVFLSFWEGVFHFYFCRVGDEIWKYCA